MAGWSDMSGAARGAAAGAVVCVAGLLGWVVYDRAGPEVPPVADAPVVADATATAESQAAAPAVTGTEATVTSAAAVAVEPVLPGFDVVRVETDGSATVAGKAPAGALVSLRLDGVEFVTATADGTGQFASLFTLQPSDAPRLLTLSAKLVDGTEVLGKDSVALAPIAAPVAVAAATPDAASAEAGAAGDKPAIGVMVVDGVVKALVPQNAPAAETGVAGVALDTIAYGPDGSVLLGGHGAPLAAVRIYLDGAQKAEAAVGADAAWSVSMKDIEPKVYTLRLDQLDAAGKVTARFETPFKRETLEALAQVAAPAVPEASDLATQGVATQAADTAVAKAEVAEPVVPEASPAVDTVAASAPALGEATPSVAPEVPVVEAPAPTETAQSVTAEQPVVSAEVPAALPTVEAVVAPAKAAPVTVTVQPGFTLWGIAQAQFGEGVMYVQVYQANKDKIRDPDLIYPGQVFTLPGSN